MEINGNELTGGMKVFSAIVNILMIAIGFYLFFNISTIVWMFAAAVFAHGLLLVVKYFSNKNSRNGWDIISGVMNILFGAIMLFGGTGTRVAGVLAIEMFVAIWALFAGFSHILGSFGLKKVGVKSWGWTLAGGVLLVICGVAYIAMPLMGAVLLAGIAAIYASVAFIITGFTGLAATLSSGGAKQL